MRSRNDNEIDPNKDTDENTHLLGTGAYDPRFSYDAGYDRVKEDKLKSSGLFNHVFMVLVLLIIITLYIKNNFA